MKNLIVKSLIFICIVVCVIHFVTDELFVKKNSFFEVTMDEFYNSKQDSIDIIIFGSSHAKNSYNPLIIDKSLSTYSFNLGSAAQKLKTTNFLIEEVLKDVKPKLIVLDIFHFTASKNISDNDKVLQEVVFSGVKNSTRKFSYLYETGGLGKVVSNYSNTIKYHNVWPEMLLPNKKGKKLDRDMFRGFLPFDKYISKKERKIFKNFYSKKLKIINGSNSLDFMTRDQRDQILETYEILKEEEIELILVSAPYLEYFYTDKYMAFNTGVKYLSDSLNIDYLDFNSLIDSLDIRLNDFSEKAHLNLKGSNKISSYLSSFISKKTNFNLIDSTYWNIHLKTIRTRTEEDNRNRIINEENYNPIVDIFLKGFIVNKKFDFTQEVKSNALIFYSNDFYKYIAIEIPESLNKTLLADKSFGIHGIVYDKDVDRLPIWLRGKNMNRITWKSNMKISRYQNKNYIVLAFEKKCTIDSFKNIRLFLMDKEKYTGTIGKPIELENIKFKE